MLEISALVVVLLFGYLAIHRWWLGIWLCLAVGFAQDPLRKIITEQPVYMVALSSIVFASVVIGLLIRNYRFSPNTVSGWRNGISQAIFAMMVVMIFQLFNSYYHYQSFFIVGLGMLAYIAPLLAVFVGYYFACYVREKGIENLIRFYAICCIVSTFGIYLEYFGFESTLLGEVGGGLVIYDIGTVLDPYSGFFRSSEIAAWHIFLGSSLMMILAVRSQSNLSRLMWILGIILIISAGILTGRRKLIVTILIFSTCYWFFMLVFLRRAFRVAVVILSLGIFIISIAFQSNLVSEKGDAVYGLYAERATSVFGDIGERGKSLGLSAVIFAVKRHGLFGKGAGSSSQGAAFSGVKQEIYYEAESGLGRIVVETGLFGLLILLWLIILMIINIWKILLYSGYKLDSYASICYGLVAILIANFAHFVVAAQVFSDPFILMLLGLILGMISSTPSLIFMKDRQFVNMQTAKYSS